jgi:hypothetical protein
MVGPPELFRTLVLLGAIITGAVFWVKLNKRLYHDIFSPFNFLLFAWVIPLTLNSLNLSGLEKPWAAASLWSVIWTTISMTAVCLLPALVLRGRPVAGPADKARFQTMLAHVRHRDFMIFVVGFYAIAFAGYLYSEFITNPGGIPLVSAMRGLWFEGATHRWGKDTKWALLTPVLYFLVPLCYLAMRTTPSRTWKLILLLCVLAYPLFGVLKLSRSDTYVAALSVLAVEYYYRLHNRSKRRVTWRNVASVAAVLLVGLGLFYGVMALRMGDVGAALYANAIDFQWQAENVFAQIGAFVYGYMALPFENMHLFVDGGIDRIHPGTGITRPILSLAGQGAWADTLHAMVPYPKIISGAAGSATFLTGVFAELGLFGIAFIPALYAGLVNMLYLRMRTRMSATSLLLYVSFLYPWSWLYFNNAFGVLTFYWNAALIVVTIALGTDFVRYRAYFGQQMPQPERT